MYPTIDSPGTLVRTARPLHPEFTRVRIALDPETALEHICAGLKGITATETDAGIKVRTTRGRLLAVLVPDAEGLELHYRTAPAANTATLKARKLRQTVDAYAE